MSGIFRHRARYTAKPNKHRLSPALYGTPDVYPDWLHHFFTDEFNQAVFGDLFPGDGSGWFGYLLEPPPGSGGTSSITPTGTEIICDAPYVASFTAKASIQKQGYSDTRLFKWYQGDIIDITMRCRYTSASAEDSTLLDIEGPPEIYPTSPGIRVYVNGGLIAYDRAKIGLSNVDGTVAVPIGQDFTLRLYMELSMRTDGKVKIWINGVLGLDFDGINMPEIDTFAGQGATINLPIYYDTVEMGVSANQTQSPTVTLALVRTEFRERVMPRGGRGFRGYGRGVW